MTVDELIKELKDQIARESIATFRSMFRRDVFVGPHNDIKLGEGFAILIGKWQIGWWSTREEAFDVAQILCKVIEEHQVRL